MFDAPRSRFVAIASSQRSMSRSQSIGPRRVWRRSGNGQNCLARRQLQNSLRRRVEEPFELSCGLEQLRASTG
jgi:hypothetical protein